MVNGFVCISCHMAMVGIHNHWGTFNFSIFKMKTPDAKLLLEQSHSKFYLPYYNLQQLEKDHAFVTHKFKVLWWDILANKLKSWGILSYSLGIDEL